MVPLGVVVGLDRALGADAGVVDQRRRRHPAPPPPARPPSGRRHRRRRRLPPNESHCPRAVAAGRGSTPAHRPRRTAGPSPDRCRRHPPVTSDLQRFTHRLAPLVDGMLNGTPWHTWSPLEPTRKSRSAPVSACVTWSTYSLSQPRIGAAKAVCDVVDGRRAASSAAPSSTSRLRAGDVERRSMSPVRDQAERPACGRLRRHVQHDGAVGRAAHAAVADAHHVADALLRAASAAAACWPPPACPGSPSGRSRAAPAPSRRRRRGRDRRCGRAGPRSLSNTTARPRCCSSCGRRGGRLDDRAVAGRGCRAARRSRRPAAAAPTAARITVVVPDRRARRGSRPAAGR